MKTKVLIIDDDFINCKTLDNMLRILEYDTVFEFKFSSEWYYKKFTDVDVILLNAEFSEVDKSNFLSCIATVNQNIPLILMIKNQHLSLVNKYAEEGADDFIFLPFDENNILLSIKKNIYKKRQRISQNRDLTQDTLVKMLIPLMRALDAKDNYTLEHTQNVAALSMKIADQLNLNDNDKMLLQLSAYFHDIGKIGMPDNILQKSGALHEEEFNQIKSHPVIGSEIIGEIEELREVAKIIRHHHERYDGNGYPDGLAGQDIPYFSRILTVADVYDALTSKRVYKNELSKQHVLTEMKKNSGIQFDPTILKAFLDIAENDDNFDVVTDPIFSQNLFDKSFCRTELLTA